MRSFASDNNSSVHPLIMEALMQANTDHAIAYGTDAWTEEADREMKTVFGASCLPLYVFNGTGANAITLQMMVQSYHKIICTDSAHIAVDECGAPTKFTGALLETIPAPTGKLTPEMIHPYIYGVGDQQHSQPGAIYISQCTELGTFYTLDEIKALTTFAHQNGMYVHMDGARIANAAAALGVSLKEMTVDCGVDTLTLGGTKNGLMVGECILVFEPKLMPSALFIRKQATQLASKMRYLSCQFTAYLKDELWRTNAAHANDKAQQLFSALSAYPEVEFTQKMESNQLFLKAPRTVIDEVRKAYFFYFWNEANSEFRLVTSFDTTDQDVMHFLHCFECAIQRHRSEA